MAPNRPSGHHPLNEKPPAEDADALNRVIAKLSVIYDFFKHSGDDTFLLDGDTLLGIYLIMGDCIDSLKKLGDER